MAAEPRNLFAAMAAGELEAHLVRKDYVASERGVIMVVGEGSTQYHLEIKNTSTKRIQPQAPACAFATLADLANFKNPYPEDGPLPKYFYFFKFPDQGLAAVNPDENLDVLLETVWYLGNFQRPEVSTSTVATKGYGEEIFTLIAAPDDSPFVRLFHLIEKQTLAENLKNEDKSLMFSLLAHSTPDDLLNQVIPAHRYQGTSAIERILREGGFPEAGHPAFATARKKHETLLAELQAAIAAKSLPTIDIKFSEGDVAVAQLIARGLKPRTPADSLNPLPYHLAELKVSAPEVLDALFAFAIRDGDEYSRVNAAIAGVKLGDPRGIPILVQYLDHPEKDDGDVHALILSCNQELSEIWKKQGKYENDGKMNWQEACKRFGGLDAPELKHCRPEDIITLKSFVESRKNLRPEALEKLCQAASTGTNKDIRRNAIQSLSRSPHYNAQPQVQTLFIKLVRSGSDKGIRSHAIVESNYMPAIPGLDDALIQVLKDYQGVKFTGSDKENEDKNLLGSAFQALARMKARAALSIILPYLDRTDYFAQMADESLRQITGLNLPGKTRSDWETALKKAGFVP